jgi:hypothetical protein
VREAEETEKLGLYLSAEKAKQLDLVHIFKGAKGCPDHCRIPHG